MMYLNFEIIEVTSNINKKDGKKTTQNGRCQKNMFDCCQNILSIIFYFYFFGIEQKYRKSSAANDLVMPITAIRLVGSTLQLYYYYNY